MLERYYIRPKTIDRDPLIVDWGPQSSSTSTWLSWARLRGQERLPPRACAAAGIR